LSSIHVREEERSRDALSFIGNNKNISFI
jgi:hypothetical protein